MPTEPQNHPENEEKWRTKNWNEEDSILLIRSCEYVDRTKTRIIAL